MAPPAYHALKDIDGNWSSKRIYAFACTAAMFAGAYMGLPNELTNDLAWLAGIALGGVGLERFARR